jgi:hypothetical protein
MKIDGRKYFVCLIAAISLFFWYIGDFRIATNPLAQRTADKIAIELRMIREDNSAEMLDKNAKFLIRGEHTTGSRNEIRSTSREDEIKGYYVVALPKLGWKYMGETAEYYRGRVITRVHLFEKGDLYLKIRFEVSNWGDGSTNVRIGRIYKINVGHKKLLQ